MFNQKHLILPLAFLLLILTSCSDELTRSKAEKIIIESEGFPHPRPYKLILHSQYSISTYHKLQEKSLLTYQMFGNNMNRSVKVALTEQGNQYALSEPYLDITAKFIDVAVGTQSFGEITGMKIISETEAVVDFTVVFGDLTPFGEVLNEKPETFTVKATLNKYDDGWRVEKTVREK